MPHLTIQNIELAFEKGYTAIDQDGEPYVYVETGKYKPFTTSTLAAAKRRGYRVVRKGRSTVYVYKTPAVAA